MKKEGKGKLGSILYGLLIGIELLVLGMSIGSKMLNKTPEIGGYSSYVVATPSMHGKLEVGDVIICKSVTDFSDIKEGDIITYRGEVGSYAGKNITHEVVDTRVEDGTYYFVTKGIANLSDDPEISEDQVLSKFVYKSIVMTFFYNILTTTYGFILLIVIPIGYIIINRIVSIVKEIKEEKNHVQKVENEIEGQDK